MQRQDLNGFYDPGVFRVYRILHLNSYMYQPYKLISLGLSVITFFSTLYYGKRNKESDQETREEDGTEERPTAQKCSDEEAFREVILTP